MRDNQGQTSLNMVGIYLCQINCWNQPLKALPIRLSIKKLIANKNQKNLTKIPFFCRNFAKKLHMLLMCHLVNLTNFLNMRDNNTDILVLLLYADIHKSILIKDIESSFCTGKLVFNAKTSFQATWVFVITKCHWNTKLISKL